MNIQIANSSIDLYEDFLGIKYNEEIKLFLEKLFLEYKNCDNYIRNKNNDSQQALWFGPVDYKYGNFKNLKHKEMLLELKTIAEIIELDLGYEKDYFNSVYINRYDNGGIGYHHDNDSIFKENNDFESGKDIIVAVYSLGANSKISIGNRQKEEIGNIIAKNNSLYIMNKNFQNNLLHKVGVSNGIRYSLTFRHCV